jgi:hypothetical protein
MILIPRSLHAIWGDIRAMRFRVRNVETLEDYLVVSITHWMQGMPHTVTMVKCDECIFNHYSENAWSQIWALLSSREEIEYLRGLNDQQVKFKAKYFYRKPKSGL